MKSNFDALYDMSIDEVLTRLEFCAKDMRNCVHPDQWDHAHALAWELMNVVSRHRQSAYGIDSKFRKAPYVDADGKNLLDKIRESKEADRMRDYERIKKECEGKESKEKGKKK